MYRRLAPRSIRGSHLGKAPWRAQTSRGSFLLRVAAAEGHHFAVSITKDTYKDALGLIREMRDCCEGREQREFCNQISFFVTSAMALGDDSLHMFQGAAEKGFPAVVRQALQGAFPDVKGAARFIIGASQSLAAIKASQVSSPENPTAIKNLELALQPDKVPDIIEEDAPE